MTVYELIQKLSEYEPDNIVKIDDSGIAQDENWNDLSRVEYKYDGESTYFVVLS